MNIKELVKLRVMYDEPNECWAITNRPNHIISDDNIAEDLGLTLRQYFNMLTKNGGYDLFKDQDCVGFETKEIADKCLEIIKNYKEDDIIEKQQAKSEKSNIELNKEECETLLKWFFRMLHSTTPSDEDEKLSNRLSKYIKVEEI